MSTFAIGTYLKCLRGKISGYSGSGASGVFLMDTICQDDEVLVTIEEKHISTYINRNEPLNENITNGATKTSVCERVIQRFRNNVYPKIIPMLNHDVCNDLLHELEKSTNVSKPTYDAFKKIYDNGDYALFYAQVFIYACLQPNKEESELLPDDMPLLREVDYQCPICGAVLSKDVRGIPTREYNITSIYDDGYGLPVGIKKPSSLTNDFNKIALCPVHYNEYYDNVDEERYLALLELKASVVAKSEAKRKVNSIKLQKQIATIVEALKEDKEYTDFSFERNTTTEVRNKITDNYLAIEIESLVRQRFDYLSNVFSSMKSSKFEETKSKIHKAFEEYNSAGFNQKEIIDLLTKWILTNTGLDSEYEMAAKVIVAFFIQICEVFYAIS